MVKIFLHQFGDEWDDHNFLHTSNGGQNQSSRSTYSGAQCLQWWNGDDFSAPVQWCNGSELSAPVQWWNGVDFSAP